jgi:predicted permease
MFWRAPAFAVLAIATLAAGIGATTTVFSLVDAVLLEPLPYPDADRIVAFVNSRFGAVNAASEYVSPPRIRVWTERAAAVTDVAAYVLGNSVNVNGADRPQQVVAGRVTAGFFHVFGAHFSLGRGFLPGEDRPGAPDVVVVSHSFWRDRWAADPGVVGRTLTIGGAPSVVVGVLDSQFDARSLAPGVHTVPDVWLPLRLEPQTRDDANNLMAVARLKPGATLPDARQEAERAADAFRDEFPGELPPDAGFGVVPLVEIVVGDTRALLLLLLAAVGLVLLIVCANTANLVLSHASGRRREFAVRAALGASRGRVLQQVLTESLVLSGVGGLAGFAIARMAVPLIAGAPAVHLPRLGPGAPTADMRLFLFTLVISAATAVLFGAAPAIAASSGDIERDLRAGARASHGPRQGRTRSTLLVVETAIATVLVIASVLLARSLAALYAVDPGFDGRGVLTMTTTFGDPRFATTAGSERVIRDGLEAIRALPRIASAAVSLTGVPVAQGGALRVDVMGREMDRQYVESWDAVSPEYFNVFRIPVLRGRAFTDHDADGPAVAIINEAMARQLWPTGDPFRDRIIVGRGGGPAFEERRPRQIVGIVGNVPQQGLGRGARPGVYVPIAQVPDAQMAFFNRLGLLATWTIRAEADPRRFADRIAGALLASTDLPAARVRTMDDVVRTATSDLALNMWLMTAFAGLALSLAVIGIYAVSACSVDERRHELGVRIALGARPSQLFKMVVGQSLRVVAVGLSAGLVAAAALGRVLASFLFGVTSHDAVTYLVVPVSVVCSAAVGVWLPARRAARVSPIVALRAE